MTNPFDAQPISRLALRAYGNLQRSRALVDAHIHAGNPASAGVSAQIAVRTAFRHYGVDKPRHIYVGD